MVSDEGEVWSNKTNRYLKPSMNTHGYYKINLNGKSYRIHTLVAKLFIPNPNHYETVNHKDENKLNNRVDNLEWISDYDNNRYGSHDYRAAETKKIRAAKGEYDKAKVYGARAVLQYDLEGNLVNEFESIAEANRKTGVNPDGISAAARGKQRTSGGYIWKFKSKDAPR